MGALVNNTPFTRRNQTNPTIRVGLNPYMYRHLTCKNNPEFLSSRQQDALEYLNWYFEQNKYSFNLNSIEIITAEVRTCEVCATVSVNPSKSSTLLLDKPEGVMEDTHSVSFSSYLDNMFRVDKRNLTCDRCNKVTSHF